MEHVNGWCFRGIYKGGLWENDLHVSALKAKAIRLAACFHLGQVNSAYFNLANCDAVLVLYM